MILVVVGAPGSGKGTQAERLSQRLGIPRISTGDILRTEAQKGSPLGLRAKRDMDRGELVPDEVILGVIAERLREEDCAGGFILDGFPRTVTQAGELDRLLEGAGREVDHVVLLDTRTETVVKRLSARLSCPLCKRNYNLITDPPKKGMVCDFCGAELVRRHDDKAETVRARLEVDAAQTKPIKDYYAAQGKLLAVDGEADVEAVMTEILSRLAQEP